MDVQQHLLAEVGQELYQGQRVGAAHGHIEHARGGLQARCAKVDRTAREVCLRRDAETHELVTLHGKHGAAGAVRDSREPRDKRGCGWGWGGHGKVTRENAVCTRLQRGGRHFQELARELRTIGRGKRHVVARDPGRAGVVRGHGKMAERGLAVHASEGGELNMDGGHVERQADAQPAARRAADEHLSRRSGGRARVARAVLSVARTAKRSEGIHAALARPRSLGTSTMTFALGVRRRSRLR